MGGCLSALGRKRPADEGRDHPAGSHDSEGKGGGLQHLGKPQKKALRKNHRCARNVSVNAGKKERWWEREGRGFRFRRGRGRGRRSSVHRRFKRIRRRKRKRKCPRHHRCGGGVGGGVGAGAWAGAGAGAGADAGVEGEPMPNRNAFTRQTVRVSTALSMLINTPLPRATAPPRSAKILMGVGCDAQLVSVGPGSICSKYPSTHFSFIS
jgi:hypothetical protein